MSHLLPHLCYPIISFFEKVWMFKLMLFTLEPFILFFLPYLDTFWYSISRKYFYIPLFLGLFYKEVYVTSFFPIASSISSYWKSWRGSVFNFWCELVPGLICLIYGSLSLWACNNRFLPLYDSEILLGLWMSLANEFFLVLDTLNDLVEPEFSIIGTCLTLIFFGCFKCLRIN